MARTESTTTSMIDCGQCGKKNRVTITYSSFGPENQDRETAYCADPNCRAPLETIKCFSVSSDLV